MWLVSCSDPAASLERPIALPSTVFVSSQCEEPAASKALTSERPPLTTFFSNSFKSVSLPHDMTTSPTSLHDLSKTTLRNLSFTEPDVTFMPQVPISIYILTYIDANSTAYDSERIRALLERATIKRTRLD